MSSLCICLKKLKADIEETTNKAFETADRNSDITKLQGDLSTAKDIIKALRATCASLHDTIVHQDTSSRREHFLFEKIPKIEGIEWKPPKRIILSFAMSINTCKAVCEQV